MIKVATRISDLETPIETPTEASNRKPKIVLAHDWMKEFRGGERVLDALAEMFPEAPIYTLFHIKGSTSPRLEARRIYQSPMGRLPKIEKYYRYLLPLMPIFVKFLRPPKTTDLIISTSHCVVKGLPHGRRTKHISYIFSPMRYIYDQFDHYFGPHAKWYVRFFGRLFRPFLQWWDRNSNKRVNLLIGISKFIQERIRENYQIEPELIYPFVDLKDTRPILAKNLPKEDYFVVLSAFAPNKRLDLAIQACEELGMNLKIIGGGQDEVRLKSMAGPRTEFLGVLDRQPALETLSKAKALIFPGTEDFGIVPLESLGVGTPVIAFATGGALETLNNTCALFFPEQTKESLKQAILKFDSDQFDRSDLSKRAEDFSKERFQNEIQERVNLICREQEQASPHKLSRSICV